MGVYIGTHINFCTHQYYKVFGEVKESFFQADNVGRKIGDVDIIKVAQTPIVSSLPSFLRKKAVGFTYKALIKQVKSLRKNRRL